MILETHSTCNPSTARDFAVPCTMDAPGSRAVGTACKYVSIVNGLTIKSDTAVYTYCYV